jgi:hypothetical protein
VKYKLIAVVLALTAMSWAQTATPTEPATPQQSTSPAKNAKCPCCEKMASADAKDADSCCAHHHDMKAGGKEMSCCAGKDAKCCGGKDAKSCMKGDKTAASCCKDGCSKDNTASSCCKSKEGCCSKKTEAAMSCCHHGSHS